MKLCLFLMLSIFSVTASAKTVARVADFGGKSFVFLKNGNSKELQYGDRIPDLSQVMVDDQAYITLVDNNGNIHYLAGGTYAKVYNHMLEVQNGYIWTHAKSDSPGLINTPNSIVQYSKGDFITTVNSGEGKSQLLVLMGTVNFASSTESNISIPVRSGEFTFIDKSYERGLPRRPTRVGIKSYHSIKSVFSNISSLKTDKYEKSFRSHMKASEPESNSKVKREVASVSSSTHKVRSPGKVIYVKTYSVGSEHNKREPQSVSNNTGAHDYYKNLKKGPKRKIHKAKIKYYGFEFGKKTGSIMKSVQVPMKKSMDKADRQPASVQPAKTSNSAKENILNDINSAFEKSYNSNLQQNLKHSDEVNELIDELKTFRSDFKKNY